MSTTTEKEVAIAYIPTNKQLPIIFEIELGALPAYAISLCAHYAVPGTEIPYGATRLHRPRLLPLLPLPRYGGTACYALAGTDIRHATATIRTLQPARPRPHSDTSYRGMHVDNAWIT
eukprot:2885988-Rhodomonas_salina.1